MVRLRIAFVALLAATAAAPAQTATVQLAGEHLLVVDPIAQRVTTVLAFPSASTSLGHTHGPDGRVFATDFNVGSVLAFDLATGTRTRVAIDLRNEPMGDPLTPALDHEARGGPGLWIPDARNLTSGSLLRKNSVRVDIATGAIRVDSEYPTPILPGADTFPNPLRSNEMIGVGSGTARQIVHGFEVGRNARYLPRTIASLPLPVSDDAFIHEDAKLYCWTSGSSRGTAFIVVDIATGATTVQPIRGIPHTGDGSGAVWNDPWEVAGKRAWVLNDGDDTIYSVDLSTNPAVATAVMVVPRPAAQPFRYNSGRDVEEAQLSTWRVGDTGRNFHVNFGPSAAGKQYVVVPTLSGLRTTPYLEQGMEIWMEPDVATIAALEGKLGYAASGTLDATGQADVRVDLGIHWAVGTLWGAVLIDNNRCIDFANYVRCRM